MHFTSSTPVWGSPPSERIPMQPPVGIPLDTQVQEALIERAVLYSPAPRTAYGQTPGGVVALNTPEMPLVRQLLHARQLTSRLIRSKAAQFSVIRKPAGAQLQATELGWEVVQLLSSSVGDVEREYPCHALEPRIELFLACATKRNLMPLGPLFVPMAEAHLLPLVDSLNGFAHDVRKRGSTASFKAKVVGFQAQTDQRYKAMQLYFRQLCILHPDAHSIRMDFSYMPNQHMGFAFGQDMHQTVTLHGKSLLEHLPKTLGKAVAGYAWKRDFAATRGYQYHLVAILNGPQAQELNGIAQSWGEHWCQSITGGTGLWINCHGTPHNDFRYRGISALKNFTGTLQEHLSLVPLFMAHTDAIAAFAPPGKAKPYGMGVPPGRMEKKAALQGSSCQATGSEALSGGWPFPA